nr:hypothetical protein CFP56_66616 [Quercus suber]
MGAVQRKGKTCDPLKIRTAGHHHTAENHAIKGEVEVRVNLNFRSRTFSFSLCIARFATNERFVTITKCSQETLLDKADGLVPFLPPLVKEKSK